MAGPKDGAKGIATTIAEGLRWRWRRLDRSIRARLGAYDRWREVDWSRVQRLVFVCSGNICRSPYAECHAVSRRVPAVSCGLTARGGAPADPTAIEVAFSRGADLKGHASRNLLDVAVDTQDLLVAMDLAHLDDVRSIAEKAGSQATVLGLWDHEGGVEIKDPFGLPRENFELCFSKIERCMDSLLQAGQQNGAWIESEPSEKGGRACSRLL